MSLSMTALKIRSFQKTHVSNYIGEELADN